MVKSEGKSVEESFHMFPEFFQGLRDLWVQLSPKRHNQLYQGVIWSDRREILSLFIQQSCAANPESQLLLLGGSR